MISRRSAAKSRVLGISRCKCRCVRVFKCSSVRVRMYSWVRVFVLSRYANEPILTIQPILPIKKEKSIALSATVGGLPLRRMRSGESLPLRGTRCGEGWGSVKAESNYKNQSPPTDPYPIPTPNLPFKTTPKLNPTATQTQFQNTTHLKHHHPTSKPIKKGRHKMTAFF